MSLGRDDPVIDIRVGPAPRRDMAFERVAVHVDHPGQDPEARQIHRPAHRRIHDQAIRDRQRSGRHPGAVGQKDRGTGQVQGKRSHRFRSIRGRWRCHTQGSRQGLPKEKGRP